MEGLRFMEAHFAEQCATATEAAEFATAEIALNSLRLVREQVLAVLKTDAEPSAVFEGEKRLLECNLLAKDLEIQRLRLQLAVPESPPERVKLDVGGTVFVTTRTTLIGREPDTFFHGLLSGNFNDQASGDAIFIDQDPDVFRPILHYLRTGHVRIPEGVRASAVRDAAAFFALSEMLVKLQDSGDCGERETEVSVWRNQVQIYGTPPTMTLQPTLTTSSTELPSPLDERAFQQLMQAGGWRFHSMTSNGELVYVRGRRESPVRQKERSRKRAR